MHEFSLVADLLKVAQKESSKAEIIKLDKIIVRIGNLSGINVDSIEFAFGFLREESEITREAELVVERVTGKGRCTSCEVEFDLDTLFLYCPNCKTPTLEITQGREFILVSLEGTDEADVDECQEYEK